MVRSIEDLVVSRTNGPLPQVPIHTFALIVSPEAYAKIPTIDRYDEVFVLIALFYYVLFFFFKCLFAVPGFLDISSQRMWHALCYHLPFFPSPFPSFFLSTYYEMRNFVDGYSNFIYNDDVYSDEKNRNTRG